MTRTARPARRSGDPRKRAAPAPAPDTGTRLRVVVAVVAALGLAVLALVVLRPGEEEQGNPGRDHAEVACDLTSRAEEATAVESDARLAAAVLLLDQAIIASARAADDDAAFAALDQAVQDVHTAGHQGDPPQWRAALATALAQCGAAVGG